MRQTQNQNESIKSIMSHGHVFLKDYFVLSAASCFLYVMLSPNLMVVQRGFHSKCRFLPIEVTT